MTDDHHFALVRLAALLWSGADASGEHQLARAHRLARWALRRRPMRGGGPDYREARGRVLRHILVEEQHPKPAQLSWRLHMEPVAPSGDAGRLSAEISEMTPESRAAYLLVRLEGLEEDEALGELAAAGRRAVVDPGVTLARVEAATGLSADRQCELLSGPDLDPARVLVSRRARLELLPRLSRRYLVAAGALVLAVAATAGIRAAVGAATRTANPWDEVRTVAAGEWRKTERPGLSVWPTTGNLRGDTALLQEAARAWYLAGRGASVDLYDWPTPRWWPDRGDRVQVLFAGNVDGRTTVLMRQHDLLAQYTRPGPLGKLGDDVGGGIPRLAIRPLPDPPASGAFGAMLPMGTVSDTRESSASTAHGEDPASGQGSEQSGTAGDAGVRFLVPPWLTRMNVSGLDGSGLDGSREASSRPNWRPVQVSDGVTAPLRVPEGQGCRSALLMSWKGEGSWRFAVYRPDSSSPTRLALIRPSKDEAANLLRSVTSPAALQALRGVLCDDALLAKDVTVDSLDLGVVWRGRLPDATEPVSLVYVKARYVGSDAVSGRATEAAAFVGGDTGRRAATYVVTRRPYRDAGITEAGAVATWWRAESGRWYYLVAGGSNVERIRLSGGIAQEVYDREAAVPGPSAAKPDDLPKVKVEAFDAAGEPVPVATR
ncbi:MAG: hypothetical protein GEV03_01050 [Streptosporangiales bacterium]|nr:hypothetical protein [Streptosporangiales bacterium]